MLTRFATYSTFACALTFGLAQAQTYSGKLVGYTVGLQRILDCGAPKTGTSDTTQFYTTPTVDIPFTGDGWLCPGLSLPPGGTGTLKLSLDFGSQPIKGTLTSDGNLAVKGNDGYPLNLKITGKLFIDSGSYYQKYVVDWSDTCAMVDAAPKQLLDGPWTTDVAVAEGCQAKSLPVSGVAGGEVIAGQQTRAILGYGKSSGSGSGSVFFIIVAWYRLTADTTEEPSDSIDVRVGFSPADGAYLQAGSDAVFQAQVCPTLKSHDNAIVTLGVFDQNGALQPGIYDHQGVPKTDPKGDAQCFVLIAGITIQPGTTSLSLGAFLHTDMTQPSFKSEVFAHYPIQANSIDLVADHIEVVQAVQTPDNAVPLVADKRTVARVFVRNGSKNGGDIHNITGTLTADEFPGDKGPTPQRGDVVARTSVDRTASDSALVFELPYDWKVKTDGDLHLKASVSPPSGLKEERTDNNGTSATVRFAVPPNWPKNFYGQSELSVEYVSVCTLDDDGKERCPTATFGATLGDVLGWLYPSGHVLYLPGLLPKISLPVKLSPSSPERQKAEAAKLWRYLASQFYLAQKDLGANMLIGWVGDIRTPAGKLIEPDEVYPSFDFSRRVRAPAWWFGDDGGSRALAGWRLARGAAMILGVPRAAAKATTGEVGFDTLFERIKLPTLQDLMSKPAANSDFWISPDSFKALFNANALFPAPNSTEFNSPKADAIRAPEAGAGDYLVARGTANTDGTSATFDPAYRVSSDVGGPPSDPDGDWCLRFYRAAGNSVDYCFSLLVPGGDLTSSPFVVKAPYPADTTRVALRNNGNEVTSMSAGSGAPSLNILSPQAGAQWQGQASVRWSASDPGGRPLTYAVLYSFDNGNTWETLAIDLTSPQFDFDCTRIGGGNQVLFRVIASSGLLSTTATAGPIEVVQKPRLDVSPNAVDFGNRTIADAATSRDLVLTSSGSGPLSVTGTITASSAFVAEMPSTVFAVPAGSQLAIPITFAPSQTGPSGATLTLTSNDPDHPRIDVALKGVAFDHAVPSIVVSPVVLDFGSVAMGQSKDLVVTVQNVGVTPLNVASVTCPNAAFTAPIPATKFAVDAGKQVDVTVRFTPKAAGAASDSLRIASDDPTNPIASVSLSGTGTGTTSGKATISVTPASLDFGSVTVGQTKDLPLTVKNTGTATLHVSSITRSNTAFSWVSPAPAFTVAAGVALAATVRFTSPGAGIQSGTITIASDDPDHPAVQVAVSGTGTAPSNARISVAPARLDFGPVTVSQTKDLNLTVSTNSGTDVLTITSIATDSPQFTVVSPAAPFSITPNPFGGTATVVVRFKPGATGPQNGNLTIVSNAINQPSLVVPMTGTGSAAASGDVVLKVDGGRFDAEIGIPNGADMVMFVNRLTPPSYPATLKNVQVYFSTRSDGLKKNAPITVISATNPGGSPSISALSAGTVNLTTAAVTSLDAFTTYPVPSLTIQSGDFVVGFMTPNPTGIYPADLDDASPSQRRSYISFDGLTFSILDDISRDLAGNFGIRATVSLGGSGSSVSALIEQGNEKRP